MGNPDTVGYNSNHSGVCSKACAVICASIAVQRPAIDTVPADASYGARTEQEHPHGVQGADGQQPRTIHLRTCKRLCGDGDQPGLYWHEQLYRGMQPLADSARVADALPGEHTRQCGAVRRITCKPAICHKVSGVQHKQRDRMHQPVLRVSRLLHPEPFLHVPGPVQPYVGFNPC